MKKRLFSIVSSILLAISLAACQSTPAPAKTAATTDKTPVKETSEEVKKEPNDQAVQTNSTAAGKMQVYYLDVGQGDSIYIKTPNGDDILIDGGNNDRGDDVVAFLKKYHVDDLEVMIATHPDADHIGGLDTVLQNFDVKSVYMPKVTHTTKTFEDFILAVKNEGLKLKEAKAGVSLELAGVDAEFVGPVTSYGEDLNSSSAVLKMTYDKNTFLFTGDAAVKAEQDMIASGTELQADVLKLGHHGANTSTSEAFLTKVQPKYAIVSAGKNNQYGHPTAETLQKMQAHNIQVFRTDEQGTIIATSDGSTITFHTDPAKIEQNTVKNNANDTPANPAVTQAPQTTTSQAAATALKAKVDNPTPGQNETIHLDISGMSGAPFTAVFHYKSKDTTYTGTVGTTLPVRISRAAAGFEVLIDITVQADGKEYQTQTSFIPQ
ncbi:ComEC/Rec2 family competence protein [Neobacillus novalis]|uniref:ComEC/Rec2 family competence protein n=1 Tax=Neobacillus novalis TaxID=220687 RepID=A0AA95SD85_9BACI|nr:ComEC/Rec2 family competence protein [Neobacillus novalis]WHY88544.1 ComEC/Rec2 family competence protein [Neobacillus novalis]